MDVLGAGRWTVLTFALMLAVPALAQPVACVYWERGGADIQAEHCGALEPSGLLRLEPDLLARIRWNDSGMACMLATSEFARGWYDINQNGLGRRSAFLTDNGCRPFKHGVDATEVDGHVVLFNPMMDVVKATNYRWFGYFFDGHAKVCRGELSRERDNSPR
ncbi:hypothetical protein [Ferrimonas pelagia]|uniref:Uncharacterized protein n=1 Tax=Ferrimonas pelagia TaxID=1177826 RepID=A0ABP9EP53_9GAMM